MYELLHNDAVISQVWGMTEFGRITSSQDKQAIYLVITIAWSLSG